MAKGPSYRLPFRRRREGKTDYKARRAMILSKMPRVVTRRSLRHMNVQIVEATSEGDKIIAAANSRELHTYGWKATCGNIPSAYLTGLLCGKRAVEKKLKGAIADIGLTQPTKGARVFASIKGVLDAGVTVPQKTDKFPSEERLSGQHITKYAAVLASSEGDGQAHSFSQYQKAKLSPEKLEEHFEDTKKKIQASGALEKKTGKEEKLARKSVHEKKRKRGKK